LRDGDFGSPLICTAKLAHSFLATPRTMASSLTAGRIGSFRLTPWILALPRVTAPFGGAGGAAGVLGPAQRTSAAKTDRLRQQTISGRNDRMAEGSCRTPAPNGEQRAFLRAANNDSGCTTCLPGSPRRIARRPHPVNL